MTYEDACAAVEDLLLAGHLARVVRDGDGWSVELVSVASEREEHR